jgi:hypothetical protein
VPRYRIVGIEVILLTSHSFNQLSQISSQHLYLQRWHMQPNLFHTRIQPRR